MMVALIEGVAAKCVVQELPDITQSHVVEPPKKEGASKNFSIVTEGANLGVHVMRSCLLMSQTSYLTSTFHVALAVPYQTCSRSGKSTARRTSTARST